MPRWRIWNTGGIGPGTFATTRPVRCERSSDLTQGRASVGEEPKSHLTQRRVVGAALERSDLGGGLAPIQDRVVAGVAPVFELGSGIRHWAIIPERVGERRPKTAAECGQ